MGSVLISANERKRDAFLKAKADGVVRLDIYTRVAGVVLPKGYYQPLTLSLNLNHDRGSGDLEINDFGVAETLRFSGVWFRVKIPWQAVIAIASDEKFALYYRESENLPVQLTAGKPWVPRSIQGNNEVLSVERELAAEDRRRAFRCIKGDKQ